MTVRAKARMAAAAIAALAAPLMIASPAHAASGGGCRAWYSYSGYQMDLQVRPCISASGNTINGSGYLLGGITVNEVELRLVQDGVETGGTWDYACGDSAGSCTASDNMTFGWWPTGHWYAVNMYTNVGGDWYGPVESPVLHT